MNLLKTICNITNRYASPFEMADDGIMGMNQRNVNFIGRYNKRNLFPHIDNKLCIQYTSDCADEEESSYAGYSAIF